jgi:cystathionine beta-lyase
MDVSVNSFPGADFGDKNFVRINFGCPRSQLEQAVALIKAGC